MLGWFGGLFGLVGCLVGFGWILLFGLASLVGWALSHQYFGPVKFWVRNFLDLVKMLGPVKMLRPVKMMGEQTARTTCESRSKLQNKLGWFGGSLSNINLT